MSPLLFLLRKRAFLILCAVSAGALTVAVTLYWNARLSGFVNAVSAGAGLPDGAAIEAAAIMVAMGAVNYAGAYIPGYACECLSHDLRMGYARYFASLPFEETEQLNVGDQASKLQNEIAEVSGYINGNLFQLVNDALRFIMTFAWLLFTDAKLTLTVYLPVLPAVIYVVYASKVIRTATERSQQARSRMNAYADTLLTLFPVIRLFDASPMYIKRYDDNVTAWERETVRSERTRARLMSPSGLFGAALPLLVMFGVGGGRVIDGTLAVGTLYVFVNLSGNVSGVLMNMPGYIAAFRQFAANMERISARIIIE